MNINIDTINFIYHFSYGSNMADFRIKSNCPNAERIFLGKLEDFQFGFGPYFSYSWNGNAATIVPKKNYHVWGSIWKIPKKEILKLDNQESVHKNVYFTKYLRINVYDFEGNFLNILSCYVYILTDNIVGYLPSKSYLYTIIEGAQQSKLPNYYIDYLQQFEHNGRETFVLDMSKTNI